MLTLVVEVGAYSKKEASRLIKRIARNGHIRITNHATERMLKRDISMQDIRAAIYNGKVKKKPRFDNDHKNWKYTITGSGIDVSRLEVPIQIDEDENYILIITVY